MDALNGRNVERRRQIVDDRVEQRLDALVLERRAAKDRDERLHQRALADQRLELGDVGDGAFEIGFHRVVVLFDGELDELFAIFGGLVGEVGGDFLIEEFGAKAFVLPDDRTLVDEVDEALEVAFGARSEEHTSELQSLMRISYAVFCLKKKKNTQTINYQRLTQVQQATK